MASVVAVAGAPRQVAAGARPEGSEGVRGECEHRAGESAWKGRLVRGARIYEALAVAPQKFAPVEWVRM